MYLFHTNLLPQFLLQRCDAQYVIFLLYAMVGCMVSKILWIFEVGNAKLSFVRAYFVHWRNFIMSSALAYMPLHAVQLARQHPSVHCTQESYKIERLPQFRIPRSDLTHLRFPGQCENTCFWSCGFNPGQGLSQG